MHLLYDHLNIPQIKATGITTFFFKGFTEISSLWLGLQDLVSYQLAKCLLEVKKRDNKIYYGTPNTDLLYFSIPFICGIMRYLNYVCEIIILPCHDWILLCDNLISSCGNLILLCDNLISLCDNLISLCGNLISLCGNLISLSCDLIALYGYLILLCANLIFCTLWHFIYKIGKYTINYMVTIERIFYFLWKVDVQRENTLKTK